MRHPDPLRVLFSWVVLAALSASPLQAQPLPSEQERARHIQRLEQITTANPRDVGAWHDLAGLYRQAADWDAAIRAETEAITRHARYAAAYYGRGKAQMGKKSYAAARADFTTAIDLWQSRGGLEKFLTVERPPTELVDAYRTRGVALFHEGEPAAGIADVSIAMRLRKDDATLHYERGHLHEKAGNRPEAIADFHRAGLLYLDRGDRANAQECVARLVGLKAEAEAASITQRIEGAGRPKRDLP